jgi:hypothetical protein
VEDIKSEFIALYNTYQEEMNDLISDPEVIMFDAAVEYQNSFFLSDSEDDEPAIAPKTEAESYMEERRISKPKVGTFDLLGQFHIFFPKYTKIT